MEDRHILDSYPADEYIMERSIDIGNNWLIDTNIDI